MKTLELILEFADRAEHFVAVLLENSAPQRGVASGDAGGIAESASGKIAPTMVFALKKGAEGRGEDLGKMADMSDDLVMSVGAHGDDFAAEVVPKFHHGIDRGAIGLGQGGDKAGAFVEEIRIAVFPTGFL